MCNFKNRETFHIKEGFRKYRARSGTESFFLFFSLRISRNKDLNKLNHWLGWIEDQDSDGKKDTRCIRPRKPHLIEFFMQLVWTKVKLKLN